MEECSQASVDEVDGSSRRKNSAALIVDAFFKLAFLKILLVDIGISLGWFCDGKSLMLMLPLTSGDTVTDFLQGFNLIFDLSTGSVR